MAVYAFSGIVLTFRNTDTFKKKTSVEQLIAPNLAEEELAGALNMKITVNKTENGIIFFNNNGTYEINSGTASYVKTAYPLVLAKMNKLHLMNTTNPLFWLAIFFGLSLMFFSISAFFMFNTGTSIYKKGLYFAVAGAALTIVLLLV
jgi:hypothetical protein